MSLSVLEVLRAVAVGVAYGFEILDHTRLPSGTVYPALSRLERDGYVTSRWEDPHLAQAEKRPPRRYYDMTVRGQRALREGLRAIRERERALRARSRILRPVRTRG